MRFYAPIVVCFGAVLLTTLGLVAVNPHLGAQYLVFGYLIPTAVIAILYGSMLAFLTSFACGFAAAYFLFPPKFTLYIAEPMHRAETAFFVLAGVVVGQVIALATYGIKREHARGSRSFLPYLHGGVMRRAGGPISETSVVERQTRGH